MKRMFAILCVILSLIFCGTAFAEEVNDVTYTSATYSSRGYSISLMWEEGILEDDELREFILDALSISILQSERHSALLMTEPLLYV